MFLWSAAPSSLRKNCPYSELFWSEYGKIRNRITPNTDTFHVVLSSVAWFRTELMVQPSRLQSWKFRSKVLNSYNGFQGLSDLVFSDSHNILYCQWPLPYKSNVSQSSYSVRVLRHLYFWLSNILCHGRLLFRCSWYKLFCVFLMVLT